MARACTVCASPMRKNIEEGLRLTRRQAAIAKEFGVSVSAIQRHRSHIPIEALYPDADYTDKSEIAKLKRLAQKEYDTAKDPKLRIAAIGRLESLAALEMRSGQVEEQARLTNHPAWHAHLKWLAGILNECASCKEALSTKYPGDTRTE